MVVRTLVSPELALVSVALFCVFLVVQTRAVSRLRLVVAVSLIAIYVGYQVMSAQIVVKHRCCEEDLPNWEWWALSCWSVPCQPAPGGEGACLRTLEF